MPNAALEIENYHQETELRKDRCDTTAGIGGGLLVYVRSEIKILPCDRFSESKFNQFCAFKLSTHGEDITLILAYRPPSSGHENTAELCDILRKLDNNTILIGDINLPGINWMEERADSRGRVLLETVVEEDLHQMVGKLSHSFKRKYS